MTDLYHAIATSSLGKKILSTVSLPVPPVLERFDFAQGSYIEGNVLIGNTRDAQLYKQLLQTLKAGAASVMYPVSSHNRIAIEQAIENSGQALLPYTPASDQESTRFKALIFDATGIQSSAELSEIHAFFQPVIRQLAPCARVLILCRPPAEMATPREAIAMRALEGFIRCVAKEIGKNGSTAQLLQVGFGAENQIEGPLRFLLSAKSAFISAQLMHLSANTEPETEKAKAKSSKKKNAAPAEPSDATAATPPLDWQCPLGGKVALVTGAARGIGKAIAQTLARDGAQVIALDIPQSSEALNSVCALIDAKPLCVDISSDTAATEIAQFVQDEYGGVDILVHNAGITRDKTLGGMPSHLWDQVIAINLSAEEKINDCLLDRELINPGGRIICVSSISGIGGNFGQSNYGTSKAGVIGMVQAMAPLLAQRQITINAVAPGFIETEMTGAIPFVIREVGRRLNTLSQGGLPVDVAELIAFYASPGAAAANGNIIRVCGQSMIGA